mmetsp:Transcript_25807/g.42382  ORF Transcript_25807/g.42382 Transcript_25807/m.42382 type:complete len:186 (+) Transcript_25807:109-666(+)
MANTFLTSHSEDASLNQYWYSENTINTIVKEVATQTRLGAAFISTPSIYFALKSAFPDVRSFLFDIDERFSPEKNFVPYDFNSPERLPSVLQGSFDVVVIDPPFITHEVWKKYAQAARLLLVGPPSSDGKIILTTIQENEETLKDLMGVTRRHFLPSIPNLVYQYALYTNFPSVSFDQRNPEIPE